MKKPNWNVESRVYGDNETPKTCSYCKYQPEFSCKTHRCIVPSKLDCEKGYSVKLDVLHNTVECSDWERRNRHGET